MTLSTSFTVPTTSKTLKFPSNNNIRYNFRRANYVTLYNDLQQVDWSELEDCSEVDECVDIFYNKLYQIINASVPRCRTGQNNFPPWFTEEIKKCLKMKAYYHRKWRSTRRLCFYSEFSRLRMVTKNLISTEYNAFLQHAEANVKRDPRAFWQYVHLRQGTSRIPSVMHDGLTNMDTPSDIVEGFAKVFSETYMNNEEADHYSSGTMFSSDSFGISSISDDDVSCSISKLKSKFTAGEDQIPAFLVKDCRMVFVTPLRIIFNLSIRRSYFPKRWKRARICPVHKKDDRADINNYRPISILCNFSKVFEQIIYNTIFKNIGSRISDTQHGFVKGRSTVTNLLNMTQDLSICMNNRSQIDVIYTDFTKAFDSINHKILLKKLDRIGFNDNFLTFVQSYLRDRVNYVSYSGYTSSDFLSTSGVPQGSNLGPLLFLIFINDLFQNLTCPNLAYADDVKIYKVINSQADAVELQKNIDGILHWCQNNLLDLNISKCSVVRYTKKKNPIVFLYQIQGEPLKSNTTIKDLGVLFDNQLSFSGHIQNVSRTAIKLLGFIMRSSQHFTDLDALKTLYFALVRSKLEYASTVWHPIYICHTLQLERVQRRFLKYVSFKRDGVYPNRNIDHEQLLDEHNVLSLASRREISGANFLQGLISGKIDCSTLLERIEFTVPRISSRNTTTFSLPFCRSNVMVRSPVYQMCRNADKLFQDIFVDKCLKLK